MYIYACDMHVREPKQELYIGQNSNTITHSVNVVCENQRSLQEVPATSNFLQNTTLHKLRYLADTSVLGVGPDQQGRDHHHQHHPDQRQHYRRGKYTHCVYIHILTLSHLFYVLYILAWYVMYILRCFMQNPLKYTMYRRNSYSAMTIAYFTFSAKSHVNSGKFSKHFCDSSGKYLPSLFDVEILVMYSKFPKQNSLITKYSTNPWQAS